jgi:F-type H+-transporting ATPase subunit delta
MNLGKISIRYARALYTLAEEKELHHQVYQEMSTVADSFISLPQLTDALSNPMYSVSEKEKLLTTSAGTQISPIMRQFIHFVIEKGREEFMLFIAMSYQDIYRKEQKIVLGKITSARQMNEESLARIKKYIAEHYDSNLLLTTHVDPAIIGGFVMEVNNFRFDVSVRTELQNIQKQMVSM